MKAYLESYGCALNRGEAMEFESALRAAGWEISDTPEEANLNVIVTCAVIETTELEMIRRVRLLNSIRRPLVVAGCMSSAMKGKVEEAAPSARFVSPDRLSELCEIAGISDSASWTPNPWPGTYCHTIPIASGCLGACAYCITKIARGDLKSRHPKTVTDEIRRIDFSQGTKEIQLTAQDTACYGRDIGSSLPELIKVVASLDLPMKVRVGMMNPRNVLPILDDLVNSYSSNSIFRFLHLPVQSGSDSMLDEMGRRYSVSDFMSIVGRFREKYAGLTLSTDLIVGYPGETEEDHQMNVELIRSAQPDIVNITRFSPRPGTKAHRASGRVSGAVAKKRSREMTDLRFSISLTKNEKKIGKEFRVAVTEEGTGGTMIGRTDNYEQVILPGGLRLGSVLEVEIVDCSPIHIVGRPLDG